MKMYAAALLALGTAAMQLSDDTEGHPVDGEGNRVLPHEAPTCPAPPSAAEFAAATASPEAFATVIDSANADQVADGTITEREVFNALYCLVEWEGLTEEEAWAAFDGFQEAHGAGGEVSVEDAAKDIAALLDDNASECDDRELPHEAPTCPAPPSDEEAAAIFASPASFAATVDAANADKVADGKITEREAFNALYCMYMWGAMNKCDAFDAFDHFQETYGAGGEVSVEDAAADIEASMAEE